MIEKLTSVAIITCWYGDYPWYFPYFIHSCSFNPTIDFLIITDNKEIIANKPENVKVVFKTIKEIKTIASEKLGFNVAIDTPYKLCDFKPAYGFLFSEMLDDYTFWGHGDLDLVYGNIRVFMTEELFQEYDVISSRHDYITGSFCLFRNNESINKLFMESRDYKEVFTNSENFCFDECNYLFLELTNGASIFDFSDRIQSMTYLVKKAEREERLKAFFDFLIIEGTPGKLKFDNGQLTYKNIFEVMFYHLIKFKEDCKMPILLNPIPNTYCFTIKNIKATL